MLYKKHGRGYKRYNTNNEGRRTRAGHNGFIESIWIPGYLIEENLERTTIHAINGVLFFEGSAPIQRIDIDPRNRAHSYNPERLLQDLADLKESKWAVKHVMTTPSISNIIRDLIKGTIVGVSDGSYKD